MNIHASIEYFQYFELSDSITGLFIIFHVIMNIHTNIDALVLYFTGVDVKITKSTVDDCGMRFLLSAQHYIYLLKTRKLQQNGLSTACYCWAFHSEYQQVWHVTVGHFTLNILRYGMLLLGFSFRISSAMAYSVGPFTLDTNRYKKGEVITLLRRLE